MTTSHTPTPWRNGKKYKSDIYTGDGSKTIARVIFGNILSSQAAADAAHIVHYVNAHDDLVAALKFMISEFKSAISAATQGNGDPEIYAGLIQARAALAKATK
jgi:hypothetical protein